MYDVNVFGMIHMIQAVNGVYCSSKFAVEALSDALRLELYSYNIQSTVIEPGPIGTNFFRTLAQNSDDLMSNPDSAYTSFYESDSRQRSTQKKTESKEAARNIADIIAKSRLKARYKVAVPIKFRLAAVLPDSIRETMLRRR